MVFLWGLPFVGICQKLFGGHFERQMAQSLAGQEYSYRFACTFYADAAGVSAMPTQLRFRVVRKRDSQVVREFMVSRLPDAPETTIENNCLSINASRSFKYQSVSYVHEAILHPAEFGDSEGYYIVNDAPPVPRSQALNVQSPNVVLYHWFSPEYLFARLDNADQGRAATGLLGTYAYICKDQGKSLTMRLNSYPDIKVYDPAAMDLTGRIAVPLTDGALPFKPVEWKTGFDAASAFGKESDFFVYNSKPKFDNNSNTTEFEAWAVPKQNGIYSISFVTEQRRNGVKLAENAMEMYAEVGDCKIPPNVRVSLTETATGRSANPTFCVDRPVQFNVFTDAQGLTYQWYREGQPIEGATGTTLKVTESGTYYVRYKTGDACTESNAGKMTLVAINCKTNGPPAILGNNAYDMLNTTGPTENGFINTHSFRSSFYLPLSDLPKMPKTLKATIYRKRDNGRMDEVILQHNPRSDQLHLLERTCDTGVDSIQQISFDASFKFTDRYDDPMGYYLATEPICCRADADNLPNSGSSVVTYLELGAANQIKAHNTINRGHTVDLIIPFTMKACVGQPARVFLYTGNRENITAQFGGFAELVSGNEGGGGGAFRQMAWAPGFTAENFTGNQQKFAVEPRRNGIMEMFGTPEKPGVFVYRLRLNGTMQNQVYSSVYQEFRLEVNDCTPPPKPYIVVSKVGKPNVPASTDVCQDSLVQLNVKNFRSWAKLQWLNNQRFVNSATDSILIVPRNQSGLYTCRIQMPRQCPEYITPDPVRINYLPKPPISIVAPHNSICEGNMLTLTGRSTATVTSYQWLLNNQPQTGANASTLLVPQAGDYTVKIIDAKGCGNISLPFKVKVGELPKVAINAPKDYVCQGQTLNISVPVNASYKYQWYRNNQPINATTTQLTVSDGAIYSVKTTDALGCAGMSDPLIIKQLANPNAQIVAPSDQFCQGQTLTLTAQTSASGPKYEWLVGNKMQPNANSSTLVVQNAGDYAVKITDDKGCFNTSPTQKLTVNPLPTASITTPKNIVCEGKTIELSANTGAGLRYEWRRDNTKVEGATQILNVGATGSYSVVVTTPQNCSKTSDPVRIQQVKNPTVTIKAPANRICEGTTLDLTATSETAKTYQWLKDDQPTTTEGTAFVVSQTGSYTVKVVDANQCEATSTPSRVEVLTQIRLAIDSIPNLCGTAFDPIALRGTPVGGSFSGKGIVGEAFAPRIAGVGAHTLTYTVKGELECLSGSTTRTIQIKAAPKVNVGPDREIYRGSKIKLQANMGTGYKYTWQPPKWIDNASLARPTIDPDSTTYYWVIAVAPDGCASEDSVKITVVQKIYVADAFSPNGDGINDTWNIIGIEEYPDIEVAIYNRWGNVVFYEKGNTQKFFDGTYKGEPLPDGVYTYTLKAKPDGHTERGLLMITR